jgi:hypothetical protein
MTAGPFETFYASFTQQPILLWVAAALGFAVSLTRLGQATPSLRLFCLLFGLLPFFDAWLTADDVAGIGALPPTTAVVLATFFVIVGDLRYFLFLTSATEDGAIAITRVTLARAVGLSLLVPVASAVFRSFLPDLPWKGRATFLFYEAAFVCLVLALRTMGRKRAPAPVWTRPVTKFVLAYYALWVAADVVILFLHLDAGYLLRVVPNVLYYGGLLTVMSLSESRARTCPRANLHGSLTAPARPR